MFYIHNVNYVHVWINRYPGDSNVYYIIWITENLIDKTDRLDKVARKHDNRYVLHVIQYLLRRLTDASETGEIGYRFCL